jgi:carboxyl-terminal processing protease
VVPDIQLTPMTADLQEMNLFADEDHYRERDLNRTLGAGGRRTQDPPTYSLRFNLPEAVRATIRDRGSQVDDEFHVDGPIYLAREIASKMRPGSRRTQLESLKSTISALEERELSLVRADLQKMGIDWSPAPADAAKSPTPPTGLEVTLSTNRPGDTGRAGEELQLSVTVKNTGTSPVYQLHAVAKSDTGYFDERELIFGKVAPGESKTATAPFGFCQPEGRKPGSTTPVQDLTKRVCRIPFDADTQQDAVRVELSAGATRLPTVHEIRPTIQSLPRPLFAYSVQVVDNRAANQNGQLERGEGATAYLRIKNIGEGATRDAQANLRNLTGEGLLLRAGRFDLGVMKPGEERDVEFTFDVLRALEGSEVRLQLSVSDAELGAGAGEKLTLPVVLGKNLRRLDAAQGTVTATRDLVVKDDPGKDGRILGTIAKGRVLERIGTVGEMTQVRLGPTRFAFAETAALAPGGATAGPAPAWNHVLSHSPPELSVQAAELATRNNTIEISGSAKDELDGITDLVVFVGNQKVHYKPNAGPNKATLDFRVPVPLQPGTNFITVIARESEDIATRRTLVVRRDGPNGEILPTPKNHTFGENWEFDEP